MHVTREFSEADREALCRVIDGRRDVRAFRPDPNGHPRRRRAVGGTAWQMPCGSNEYRDVGD